MLCTVRSGEGKGDECYVQCVVEMEKISDEGYVQCVLPIMRGSGLMDRALEVR